MIWNMQRNYVNSIIIFPLVLDKKEIKEEMLSECQVLIADFHNIPIGNVKKLVPNFFDEKTICASLWKYTVY